MTFTKEQLINQARENVKALKMAVIDLVEMPNPLDATNSTSSND